MKKALVFGGGGSKGAYEIGVWKALDELGESFDIVCGTSIGALIGVLYVQNDYEKAFELWNNLRISDVMVDGVNIDFDIELLMSQKGKYKAFLETYVHHKGVDITPLILMLDNLFDAHAFFQSPIDFGCMMYNVTKRAPQAMTKKDLTPDNTKDYILASASCFPAFPMKEIKEELFVDGGYYDNVPISLAREMGAEEIVAVDLKSVGRTILKEAQDNLTYIEPFVSLGSFLLFDADRIHRNMELGYQDTMKKFHKYIGSIYTFDVKDKVVIDQFEECVQEALEHIDVLFNFEKMNLVVEKVVNHQVLNGLERFMKCEHKFLNILESAAYIFEIDCIGVYSFADLKENVIRRADESTKTYAFLGDKKLTLKDLIVHIKELGPVHRICFIYNYLLYATSDQVKQSVAIAVTMSESFLIAYTLFAIKKEFKLKEE